jgi:hypothetical protein
VRVGIEVIDGGGPPHRAPIGEPWKRVEFIDENGGGPGARLRKPTKEKSRK